MGLSTKGRYEMRMFKVMVSAILALILSSAALGAERQTGRVMGTMAQKGGLPLAGGVVFFFNQDSGPPPAPEKYWRVPDKSVELDKDGRFSTELAEGTYFFGSIKRPSGKDVGPPNEGDIYLVTSDIPVKQRTFTVKAGKEIDIGTISELKPFRKDLLSAGITGIEGVVIDADGTPVPGVFVFAFLTAKMSGRPLFVSEKTGADGKYLLRVEKEGEYYLKVKEVYGGGPPRQGGFIGAYGDGSPKPVEVKGGTTVKGVTIIGGSFPGQGRKPK
jgi:hypothetical protein